MCTAPKRRVTPSANPPYAQQDCQYAGPLVPSHFRDFTYPGYTNALSFLPHGCPRFYPTETLFGNWDSPILLLAKDAAPTAVMRDSVKSDGCGGWRHAQRERGDYAGWKTNERLANLVRAHQLPDPLYGSATANMLYDDPEWSRSLPGFYSGPLHDYLVEVLRWVIGNMRNLRAVACISRESWYLTAVVLGDRAAAPRAREYRDQERMLSGSISSRKIVASAHFHPSRGSREQWALGWRGLASVIKQA